MQFTFKSSDFLKKKSDALVAPVFFKEKWPSDVMALDRLLGGALARAAKEESFDGKFCKTLFIRNEGKALAAKKVILVGLGERPRCDEEAVRSVAGAAFDLARSKQVKRLVFGFGSMAALDAKSTGKAVCEGVSLAAYTFGKYKKTEKNS